MALSFSTPLKNALLDTGDLRTLLADGFIKFYAGTVPADADTAIGAATVLNVYSDADAGYTATNGFELDAGGAASGAISKEPAQVWSGTASATGTATFWRYVGVGDADGTISGEYRIQGTVGGSGADMFVQSTAIASGTLYTIDFFSVSIPL